LSLDLAYDFQAAEYGAAVISHAYGGQPHGGGETSKHMQDTFSRAICGYIAYRLYHQGITLDDSKV